MGGAVPSSLPFSSSSEENAPKPLSRRSESKAFAAKATGALLLGCSALFAALATKTQSSSSSSSSSQNRFPGRGRGTFFNGPNNVASQRSAALGVDATKNKNDEWNRLHPGFCGNWTGEENEVSPFVREAMEKAKVHVYSEKKRAASERAVSLS